MGYIGGLFYPPLAPPKRGIYPLIRNVNSPPGRGEGWVLNFKEI
jgi:hypothetical protein